jgi:pimeloyl-ACP methyl ester carboxylesterase
LQAFAAGVSEITFHSGSPKEKVHAIYKKPAEANGHSPVLFLHSEVVPCARAFDLLGYSWMDELTKEGFETWAIDLPSISNSNLLKVQSNDESFAESVALTKLAIHEIKQRSVTKKVTVIGWGMGAIVTLLAAIDDPMSIDRVVLLGVPEISKSSNLSNSLSSLESRGLGTASSAETLSIDWKNMLRGIEDEVVSNVFPQVEALVAQCLEKNDSDVIKRSPQIADSEHSNANDGKRSFNPAQLSLPTLVLQGDHDAYASVRFAQQIQGSHEVILRNSTHWVPYENGRTFMFIHVSNFLANKNPH